MTQKAYDAVVAYARNSGSNMLFAEAMSRMLEEHEELKRACASTADEAQNTVPKRDPALLRAIDNKGA